MGILPWGEVEQMTEFFGQPPVVPGGGRGFVRPRACLVQGGAALPIVKLIEPYLGQRGVIYIVGPAGSGKTWAIHYVNAALGNDGRMLFIEELEESAVPTEEVDALAVLHVARWTDDDLIEFRVLGDSETLHGVLVRVSNSVDGLSQQTTVLPFFQAITVNRDSIFLSLDARGAGTGFLYVGIFVNGLMFREASSTVTNPFVAVSGTYHRPTK